MSIVHVCMCVCILPYIIMYVHVGVARIILAGAVVVLSTIPHFFN